MIEDLLFFDFETTGPGRPDPDADMIIQFTFRLTGSDPWTELVNPGDVYLPIPAERTAVHGIETNDVRLKPPFAEHAGAIQNLVDDAVLVGYGSRGYDVPILDRHLREAEEPGLDRDTSGAFITHAEVDLFHAWARHEPRTLAGAARRFAGVELGDEAHDSETDAMILEGVMRGMIDAFDLPRPNGPGSASRLVEVTRPEGAMDRAGRFRRRDDGTVVFAFSKHRGEPVGDHPGMLRWMLDRDFTEETKRVARVLLGRIEESR